MADTEDIQPLVCDNGTGMVKVLMCMVWLMEDVHLYNFAYVFTPVLLGRICWR